MTRTDHTQTIRTNLTSLAVALLIVGIASVGVVSSGATEATQGRTAGTEQVVTSEMDADADWVTERFGRPRQELNWSVDPRVIKEFMPSGVGDQIVRCGDYTVLSNHGLYFSYEEDPDSSKDMLASVIIFKGDQRVFVARGYKFSDFHFDSARNVLKFDYWTGVMGDQQIVEFTIAFTSSPIRCSNRFFSTKDQR